MGWRKGKLHFCCCFIKTKDLSTLTCCNLLHCEKIANIRSFPGPYFPAFELNKETYSVSLRIQSLGGKIRTRKTPNMDTFHVVLLSSIFRLFPRRGPSLLKYWHKQTTLNIPRQDYDWRMYSSILDILVCLRFISLLGLLYFIRQNLLFQKHFCILRFLRSLTVDVFVMAMMRLELRTYSFAGGKLNFLAIKVCMVKTIMYPCSFSLCCT